MAHLLIYRLNLDPSFVELLLGPFAEWFVAPDKSRQTTVDIALEADDVMELLPVLDPVRRAAATRIATMHAVYKATADRTPPESTAAYYWGLLIDTHMKLLLHPHKLMIHEVYANGLAPEQTRLASVCTDMYYPLSIAAVEKIWRPYINSAPFPVPSKRKVAAPVDPAPERRTRRKRKRPTAAIVLLPDPPEPEALDDFTVEQDPTIYRKNLTKAMPRSATVRSIKTLLRRAVLLRPDENVAIVGLVRKFLVGGYRHATAIGSAAFRVRAYCSDTAWMYKTIEDMTNKEMYAMVAE